MANHNQPLRNLSEPQRRHLTELVALGTDATWRPIGFERRTAQVLVDRGLLAREYGWGGWFYVATEAGKAAVRDAT